MWEFVCAHAVCEHDVCVCTRAKQKAIGSTAKPGLAFKARPGEKTNVQRQRVYTVCVWCVGEKGVRDVEKEGERQKEREGKAKVERQRAGRGEIQMTGGGGGRDETLQS